MSLPRNQAEIEMVARVVFKNSSSLNTAVQESKPHPLDKPLYVVSLFSDNHTGRPLNGTLQQFRKDHLNHPDSLRTLDILVAGSLQRYNFWNLTRKINNRELRNLLSNMPLYNTLEDLANDLANRLLPLAKRAENEYIFSNGKTFRDILPETLWQRRRFYTWEDMVPIQQNSNRDYGRYATYLAAITAEYGNPNNLRLKKAFDSTRDRVIEAHKKLIIDEAERLILLNPHIKNLFDNLIILSQVPANRTIKMLATLITEFAGICSRKFLFEESASLLDFSDREITTIFYPASMSKAFEAVSEMYPNKTLNWIHIDVEQIALNSVNYSFSNEHKLHQTEEKYSRNSAPLPTIGEDEEYKEENSQIEEVKEPERVLPNILEVVNENFGFVVEEKEETEEESPSQYLRIKIGNSFDPIIIPESLEEINEHYLNHAPSEEPEDRSDLRSATNLPIDYKPFTQPHDIEFNIEVIYKLSRDYKPDNKLTKSLLSLNEIILGKPLVTGCKPAVHDPKYSFPLRLNVLPHALDNIRLNLKLNTALTLVGFFKASWCDPDIDPRSTQKRAPSVHRMSLFSKENYRPGTLLPVKKKNQSYFSF